MPIFVTGIHTGREAGNHVVHTLGIEFDGTAAFDDFAERIHGQCKPARLDLQSRRVVVDPLSGGVFVNLEFYDLAANWRAGLVSEPRLFFDTLLARIQTQVGGPSLHLKMAMSDGDMTAAVRQAANDQLVTLPLGQALSSRPQIKPQLSFDTIEAYSGLPAPDGSQAPRAALKREPGWCLAAPPVRVPAPRSGAQASP